MVSFTPRMLHVTHIYMPKLKIRHSIKKLLDMYEHPVFSGSLLEVYFLRL